MTEDRTLTCQELVELVTGYLEDTLPPADRGRFEEHIAVCDGCSAYLEQMRTTIRVTGMLTPGQLSEEASTELLAAFRGWRT
ncbi:MAG: anti-sigma factor family protein [Actinomycetota bacterium]